MGVDAIDKRIQSDFEKDLERLSILKSSTSLEDKITALLMDAEIGSFGFWESFARPKAKAIVEMMNGQVSEADSTSDTTQSIGRAPEPAVAPEEAQREEA